MTDTNAVPLGNEPVYFNEKIVGKTTSATFGYRIGSPIVIANVNNEEVSNNGSSVTIDIGRKFFHGIVSKEPLFDPLGKRMKIIKK